MSEPWPHRDIWLQWFGHIPPPALARHLDKWLKPRLWSDCGWTSPWLWGQVRTRGSLTYRVVLNRSTRSSQCTCSARVQPCVHAAALLIGWQQKLWDVAAGVPLADWLPEQIQPSTTIATPGTKAATGWVTPARVKEMEQGYHLLGLWMHEQSRLGWKNLLSAGPQPAEDIATRLVDLRLPGPARLIRQLTDASDIGRHTPFMRQILSRLILACRAFTQREQLSDDQWHSLLMFTGVTIRKDGLKKQPALHDQWLALSVEEAVEDSDLRSRKIWCLGARSGKFALLLDFAWKRAPMPPGLKVGQTWNGDLHFYPGSDQVRAIQGEGLEDSDMPTQLPVTTNWSEAHDRHTTALAMDPLRMEVPLLIDGMTAGVMEGRSVLIDRQEHGYPVHVPDQVFEQLLTGREANGQQVFGLLRDGSFFPLTLLEQGRVIPLHH